MPLGIRKDLRAKNKSFCTALIAEQPTLTKKQLEEKLFDFACANGNGLCGDILAECEFEDSNPDEYSPDLFGMSDFAEYPTLDCSQIFSHNGSE